MKTWLRLLLVTVTVGGGFGGVILALDLLYHLNGWRQFMLSVIFFLCFLFVTVAGLIFVHNPKRTGLVLAALAMQIPWISSPVFVYQFATGLYAAVTLGTPDQSNRFGLHLGFSMQFGTIANGNIGSYEEVPWTVGANVFALILFILLLRNRRLDKALKESEVVVQSESVEGENI